MKERPILFSSAMVRALLDGRKTQTRRAVKGEKPGQPLDWLNAGLDPAVVAAPENGLCPYGYAGDTLWVRETWRVEERCNDIAPRDLVHDWPVAYAAGVWSELRKGVVTVPSSASSGRLRPSIHMPRWASRITLQVTDVRVERLQDISEGDAEAEGCPPCPACHDVGWINSGPDGGWQCTAAGCGDCYRDQYQRLWEQINGRGSWDQNAFVWAISFEVLTKSAPQGKA